MKLGFLVIICLFLVGCHQINSEVLTVGAVIPLTGPAAVWGIEMKNGMDLARSELLDEGIVIDVLYEDSKGTPVEAVSAFNKLVNLNDVDAITSIYSRVGTTLAPLAKESEIPYFSTLSVAPEIVELGSPYTYRVYPGVEEYVDPFFDNMGSELKNKRIALLYVNDDYGISVRNYINERLMEYESELVSEQAHSISEQDYKTHLLKIRQEDPEILLLVESAPAEIIAVYEQLKELDMSVEVVDVSVMLNAESTRSAIGDRVEGSYVSAFPFIMRETGSEFYEKYISTYGVEPEFAAPYGYDIIMLLAKATNGEKMAGDEIISRIDDLEEFESLNGVVPILDGEIRAPLMLGRISGDEIVKVVNAER